MKLNAMVVALAIGAAAGASAAPQPASIAAMCGEAQPKLRTFDDETHALWYNRFWTGVCSKGLSWCSSGEPNWLSAIRTLSVGVAPGGRQTFIQEACLVGRKVGFDWSKDNAIRKIDTNALGRFHRELKTGAGDPFARLHRVDAAADRLLGN